MSLASTDMEVWGGVECTVNRVRDAFHNQLAYSGHDHRLQDLDRFAELGIRRLRYPVLWELTTPKSPNEHLWAWSDQRLSRLQALGIEPIVGLVHHGSGPRFTHLLDERFPNLLADYALAVARRYPWVTHYTPVNEPLTTARFSALYGHWYPHHRDDRSFVRALLNECKAVILSMQAIRDVNPGAQLVQTDDLGRTYSTRKLAYQARFDNERRWLGWDLVSGRVDREHYLWRYLTQAGATASELEWFCDHACSIDVVGINHYVTSDRYLDERLDRFPQASWGGNGKDSYADVEAIRAIEDYRGGVGAVLREAWQRYGRPVAITEAHLGCTREEQVRWIHDVWLQAQQARNSGVDVRAVTVWALLGSFDWNSLVTRIEGHYEPGAFDVRGGTPRPTAIAHLVRALARHGHAEASSYLCSSGWWRRPERLFPGVAKPARLRATARSLKSRPLLITGGGGRLGSAFARLSRTRGLDVVVCGRAELDICEEASVRALLRDLQPWAVVNAAGYVRIDDAESERERCFRENAQGAATLATACAESGARFLTFSSDLVFDGSRAEPYVETSVVRPLNVYGHSKADGERAVLAAYPRALVVRTSTFFDPWDPASPLTRALQDLERSRETVAICDVTVSPTYIPDLVNASLDLLIDDESGLWHLVNQGSLSWAELVERAAELHRCDTSRVLRQSWRELGLLAHRPAFSALTSERGVVMPKLEDALERYMAAIRAAA